MASIYLDNNDYEEFRKIIKEELDAWFKKSQTKPEPEEFLNIKELSERLKYSVQTIRGMLDEIPHYKMGKRGSELKFLWSEVIHWVITNGKREK